MRNNLAVQIKTRGQWKTVALWHGRNHDKAMGWFSDLLKKYEKKRPEMRVIDLDEAIKFYMKANGRGTSLPPPAPMNTEV